MASEGGRWRGGRGGSCQIGGFTEAVIWTHRLEVAAVRRGGECRYCVVGTQGDAVNVRRVNAQQEQQDVVETDTGKVTKKETIRTLSQVFPGHLIRLNRHFLTWINQILLSFVHNLGSFKQKQSTKMKRTLPLLRRSTPSHRRWPPPVYQTDAYSN